MQKPVSPNYPLVKVHAESESDKGTEIPESFLMKNQIGNETTEVDHSNINPRMDIPESLPVYPEDDTTQSKQALARLGSR